MIENQFCIFNGHLVSLYEPSIPFSNRAFRFGDSLFESIRLCNSKIMFLLDHINRIKLGMTVLRMNVPAEFSSENINALIQTLLTNNGHLQHARIRLTVFRNEGGFYAPSTNDISFLIESEELSNAYELNQNGYWIDIFADIKKQINKLSNLKTGNAMLYIMAGLSKQSMKLDECLLINENGAICECISGNIFFVKNNAIYTSPLNDGCVAGIMRKQIMQIASENKILCFENTISTYALMDADEVFISNSISGLRWVKQFKTKFYNNKMSQVLIEKLLQQSV